MMDAKEIEDIKRLAQEYIDIPGVFTPKGMRTLASAVLDLAADLEQAQGRKERPAWTVGETLEKWGMGEGSAESAKIEPCQGPFHPDWQGQMNDLRTRLSSVEAENAFLRTTLDYIANYQPRRESKATIYLRDTARRARGKE